MNKLFAQISAIFAYFLELKMWLFRGLITVISSIVAHDNLSNLLLCGDLVDSIYLHWH